MIWWLIVGIIGGVIGIANRILHNLRQTAAKERQRWENEYQTVENRILQYNQQIDNKIREAQYTIDFHVLTNLHFESMKVADHAHKLLTDSKIALAAIGNAIVESSKEKNRLIAEKRSIFFNPQKSRDLEIEITSLVEMNRQLYQDKDKLKAQRDHFHETVQCFNARTHTLKLAIRDRCALQGQEWYRRLETRTAIHEENKKRVQYGLPQIALPEKPKALPKPKVNGIVKWFDDQKGFGFITPTDGQKDVHVTRSNLLGIQLLTQNDKVEFERMVGEKGPWARNVKKIYQ